MISLSFTSYHISTHHFHMQEYVMFSPVWCQSAYFTYQLLVSVQKLRLWNDERCTCAGIPFFPTRLEIYETSCNRPSKNKWKILLEIDWKRAQKAKKLISLQIECSAGWTFVNILIPTEAMLRWIGLHGEITQIITEFKRVDLSQSIICIVLAHFHVTEFNRIVAGRNSAILWWMIVFCTQRTAQIRSEGVEDVLFVVKWCKAVDGRWEDLSLNRTTL